jgi:hypothetical protein
MPQIVEMNGVEFEFPDGMSQDDMKVALDKHHSGTAPSIQPQEQGFAESLSGAPPLVGGPMPASSGSTMWQVSPEDAMALSQQESQAGADALQSLTDPITGASKMTPEIEGMPDISGLPEINQITSWPAWMNFFGTLTATNPEEALKVFQSNFPDTPMRQDAKGNWIVTSKIDGKDYAFQPGLSKNEVNRAVGGGALFAATGGSGGVVPAMIGGLATSTGLETAKAMQGGDFNPVNVAVDTILPLAGKALKEGGKYLGKKTGWLKEIDQTLPIGAQGLTDDVVDVVDDIPDIKEAPSLSLKDQEDIGTLAKSATESDKGKIAFAKMAQQNPAAKAAQKRLKMQNLPSDVFSDSDQFVASAAATRLDSTSKAASVWTNQLKENAQIADEHLEALGATFSGKDGPAVSVTSTRVMSRMKDDLKELKDGASEVFEKVESEIGSKTPVVLPSVSDVIDNDIVGAVDESLLSPETKNLIKLAEKSSIPYETLLVIKEKFRNRLSGKGDDFAGVSLKNIRKLDKALKEDQIFNVSEYMGKETGEALKEANINYAKAADLDGKIINLFGTSKEGSIGGKMITAIKDAGNNDTALNKLLSVIPEDLHGDVIMTAMAEASRSRQAQSATKGLFGASEFSDLYGKLRKNPVFMQKLESSVGKEGVKNLDALFNISKRITRNRVFARGNGKDLAPMLKKMTAENFVSEVMKSPMGKAITTMGASKAPIVGRTIAEGQEQIGNLLSTGGGKATERINQLFNDPAMEAFIDKAATDSVTEKDIKRLVFSKGFREFYKSATDASKFNPVKAQKWITNALQATTNKEEDK